MIDRIENFGDAYTLLRATRYRLKLVSDDKGSRLCVEGRDPFIDRDDLQKVVDHYHDDFMSMLTNDELIRATTVMKKLFGTTFECFVRPSAGARHKE